MAIFVSNTTQSLATALKDVQRLEAPEAKRKDKDTPAQSVAKAVAVFSRVQIALITTCVTKNLDCGYMRPFALI